MSPAITTGPTQTAKTEVHADSWTARPATARLLRFAMFAAPLVVSLVIAFWAARTFPPERLEMNRWIWWLGLAVVSTAIVRILERIIARLTPIATLFQLSLVFPDQAPSRFSMALRAGSARSLQRRLDDMKATGEVFTEDDTYAQQMLDLIRMLSEHDRMTRGHAERVRAYSELIGEEMGLRQDDMDKLRWGALLHDMGKLDVPSEILNKPGRPTDEEWEILQRHPAAGIPYLAPLKTWLGDWIHAADGHHERWDGGGYPRGLSGTDIPLSGRIVAVADAFDVMTSTRSYKKAMPLELGRQEVADKAGSQFDPEVARAFLKVSLGDIRRAAGPIAWFTGLPGLQNIPFGAATSQAVTTVTAATAVAVGGATGLAIPDPEPPPVIAFVEPASVEVADIAIDEDTSGTITVDVSGDGPVVVMLGTVPEGAVAVVGSPQDGTNGSTSVPISFTPALNSSGPQQVTLTACVGDECFDETVTIEIRPVNDPPTIAVGTLAVDRGGELFVPLIDVGGSGPASAGRNGAIYVSDVDGDRLSIVDVDQVLRGATTFDSTSVTFRHDRSPSSSARFVVSVSDGTDTVVEQVPVAVVNTNSSPTLVVADATVTDAATPGSVVVTLVGTDADGDTLFYELSDPLGGFEIDRRSGQVSVARLLDPDTEPRFELTATVTDSWGDSASANFVIDVSVDNEPPVLTVPTALLVAEDTEPGTAVGTAESTDPDGDAIEFSITDPTGSFSIDADSGVIYVADGLDRETQAQIAVVVTAEDSRGALSTQTIKVTVEDVNEAPIATGPNFAVFVTENSAVGTPLGFVEAVDPDGDPLAFSAVSAPSSIAVDPNTGELTLNESLDYESTPPFSFLVTVTDAGNPALSVEQLVRIVVKNVDEPVVLDAGPLAVPENAGVGSIVASLTATDPEDGQLEFSLTSPSSVFAIDQDTGEVTLLAPLDYETNPSYTLDVLVSDGVNDTSRAVDIVITDVNEAPVVTAGTIFVVDETAPPGTIIGTATASDAENDSLTFALTGGDPAGSFAIDPTTGEISVAGPLDFEITPDYQLEITATESGPSGLSGADIVEVFVDDGSESPIIADQGFDLDENSPGGTSIGTVVATDPDAGDTLTYSIVAGNGGGLFSLDPDSGVLSTAGGASIDFESAPGPFPLDVEVTDGIFSDAATVTVTVLDIDEPPAITAPLFTVFVPEDAGSVIAQVVADDPENDAVQFSIEGGNVGGVFAIDPTTGEISVVGTLDAEGTNNYELAVRATQLSDPSLRADDTIDIVVQSVDEPPIITGLPTLTVDEDEPVGFSLGFVTASDPEGESLTYSVSSPDFTLGASRELKVDTALDFESVSEYTFDIFVTDEADPDALEDQVTVTVSVGDVDEPPAFGSTPALAVDENSPAGTSIGTIVASDPDGGDIVTFAITDTYGAPSFPFELDNATGALRVLTSPDHEAADQYTFEVEISSGAGPSTARRDFTVDVNDVNEPSTIDSSQTYLINEAASPGTLVGTVSVSDPDQSPSYTFSIQSGNTAGAFAIDDTGRLTVANPLDYETLDTYTLGLELIDGPFTSTETVTVTIEDGPEPPVLTVVVGDPVEENSPAGTPVAQFTATDPDATGTITYAITSGAPHPFALDPDTGALTVATPSDFEAAPNTFAIEVEAFDGTSTSDPVTITVPIVDVNESPTAFPGQAFTIAEDASTTAVIHTFGAADPDSGDSLDYEITGGTVETFFRINSNNGRIRYNGGLDYDDGQTQTLVVTVTDQAGLQSTATIDITVTSRIVLSPSFGEVVFNEVLYFDSGPGEQYIEFVNVSSSTVDTTGWYITDHEPGTEGAEDWAHDRLDQNSYEAGEIGLELVEHYPGEPLRDPLARIDDLWLWDDQDRLVAYMAWGDASGPGSEITSRPPIASWGLWSTDYEIALGTAADGQSISRTPNASTSVESGCWEPTTSNDAQTPGRCAGALRTLDTTTGVASLNESNTLPELVISELAVNGMYGGGDFVEIYNRGALPVDVEEILLEITDDNGTDTFALTIVAKVLEPGRNMLFVESGTTLGFFMPNNQEFSPSITPTFGVQLYMYDTDGTRYVLDSVGNQDSTRVGISAGAHREGAGLADPYPDAGFDLSYERLNAGGAGNCVDTDDNAADFIRNFRPGTVNPRSITLSPRSCAPLPVPPGPADHLIISEWRTDGPGSGSNEFVEFFNPTSGPIDVSGWELHDDGGDEYTFPGGTVIPAGGHWLIGDGDYLGPTDGSYNGVGNGNNEWYLFDAGGIEQQRIDIDTGSADLPPLGDRWAATFQAAAGGCAHDEAGEDRNYIWSSTPTPRTAADPPQPCS